MDPDEHVIHHCPSPSVILNNICWMRTPLICIELESCKHVKWLFCAIFTCTPACGHAYSKQVSIFISTSTKWKVLKPVVCITILSASLGLGYQEPIPSTIHYYTRVCTIHWVPVHHRPHACTLYQQFRDAN